MIICEPGIINTGNQPRGVTLAGGSVAPTRLLADRFSGANGTLINARVADTVWTWGGWWTGGNAANTWALNGDGSVSNTANPGTGTRHYHTWHKVLTSEPSVTVTLTTPVSGNYKAGVLVRLNTENQMWRIVLNKATNNLEIIAHSGGSDPAASDSDSMGTLLNGTSYTIVVTCVDTLITATCGSASVSVTSATNQDKINVGLTESVAPTDGHSKFYAIDVEPASDTAVSTRVFLAPANGTPSTEFDSIVTTGTASAAQAIVNGNGRHAISITANGATGAYRAEFMCKDTGPVPNPEAVWYNKNLPDIAYYGAHFYFTSQIQRLGAWWNLFQWKQRDSASTWPVYSLNIGWTTDHMHFELNTNMDADGSYNGQHPDLSDVHYDVPLNQWVWIEAYYRWSATDGRVAFWMDGDLMWDFDHIQTLFTTGKDWTAPQNARLWVPSHYSDNLGAGAKVIYWDNCYMAGMAQPTNYPSGAPV